MSARRFIWVMVIVGAAALVAWIETHPKPHPHTKLITERVETAKKALEQLKSETADPSTQLGSQTRWYRRIAETRRDLGGQDEEVIADLQAYVKHLEAVLGQVDPAEKASALDTRYELAEAKTWLTLELEARGQASDNSN